MCTLAVNKELNGIELSFDSKPSANVLESLKKLGFKWHNVKKLWYAKADNQRLAFAETLASIESPAVKVEKLTEKINRYGVQVGDVFYNSWGWEQTNIDFWQVTEIKGETRIILKAIGGTPTISTSSMSEYVIPVKDQFLDRGHYAGIEIKKTVKQFPNGQIYCSMEHGLLNKTTWTEEHHQSSWY